MEQSCTVLLVANYSNITGYAWSNIYRLFNSIAIACHKNNIFTCISFAEIIGQVNIIDIDIPSESFEFSPYKISFRSLNILRRAIKKYNIKYVYFTDMKTWHWLYILLRIWGVRKIIVHCRVSVESPHRVTPEIGLKRFIKSMVNGISIFRADYVYAISEFVRDRLVNKNCYPKERVIKILNGIDIDKYMCKEEYTGHDNVSIFCCARATHHKGIPTLIKAANILKKKYKLDKFCIQYAGDGPNLDEFKALAKELNVTDKIYFLGMLNSTHEVACNSDIIVVPSEWGEGFGSTVAEGMAAGKAVVATNAGGIPEVIGNTECGVLVKPGDSDELAKALYVLIEDDDVRRRLGQKAKKRAREKFNEVEYHRVVTDRILHDIGI